MMSETALAPDLLPTGYPELLADLKERIRAAQVRAALSVNRELILLYWTIGTSILRQQEKEGWGSHVIDKLAQDLKKTFPKADGFFFKKSKIYEEVC